jgi:hypothetical protein
MRPAALVAMLLTFGFVGLATAQENAPEPSEKTEVETTRPRRTLRILQDPKDLASFYASRPGLSGPTPPVPADPAYALAHYYRSQPGAPAGPPAGPWIWAAFWAHGYDAPRPTPLVGYRRSIGEHGDLFLVVPFLAPVGPLSGAFAGY